MPKKLTPFIYSDDLPALHKASLLQRKIEVKDLLKNVKTDGGILEQPDSDGRVPLHYAADNGNLDVLGLLMKADKKRATLNLKDNYKWTPLHYAARNGHYKVQTLPRENRNLFEGLASNSFFLIVQ
jgi:ankyrin repeat protein